MEREIVSCSLLPELSDGRLMKIKLNFKDPRTISSKSEFDLLEIIVKESLHFRLTSNQVI
jgi:hypothetical protein